jgi:hypothetical protein
MRDKTLWFGEKPHEWDENGMHYSAWRGCRCDVCGRHYTVLAKWLLRGRKEVWCNTTVLCGCGMSVYYASGKRSWIPAEKFDPNKMIFDNLKKLDSSVKLRLIG